MRITLTSASKRRLLDLVKRHRRHADFIKRRKRNLNDRASVVSSETFWKSFVMAILTTQQASGSGSKVDKFLRSADYRRHFSLSNVTKKRVNENHLSGVLEAHQLRFKERPVKFILSGADQFQEFYQGQYEEIKELSRKSESRTLERERSFAMKLKESFVGIGSKQSRNWLQSAGLSRFVLPLDSRWGRIMSENDLALKAAVRGLASNESSYRLLEQALVSHSVQNGIFPCMLDAAVFIEGKAKSNEEP